MTGMAVARYDDVAEFYEAGWSDDCDDPATVALLALIGDIRAARVLDVACGHGRVTRELARRGARVVGVDISQRLLKKAQDSGSESTQLIDYVDADIADDKIALRLGTFDTVVCNFGLSDIDDLDGALRTIAAVLRPGGSFVLSILHPCFPGAGEIAGAWPSGSTYRDEGWWLTDRARSTLRRRVGAHHRMVATYLNALLENHFIIDTVREPGPPEGWARDSSAAIRYPVFLVVRSRRM